MAEAERLLGASYNPSKVLLFCGKRKSGKDFVTENLSSLLKVNIAFISSLWCTYFCNLHGIPVITNPEFPHITYF